MGIPNRHRQNLRRSFQAVAVGVLASVIVGGGPVLGAPAGLHEQQIDPATAPNTKRVPITRPDDATRAAAAFSAARSATDPQDQPGEKAAPDSQLRVRFANPITDEVFLPYLAKSSGRQPGDTPFFGMQIESVVGNARMVTVTTTGAQYVLGPMWLTMIRRIDPQTNNPDPREVAQLAFSESMGSLLVSSVNKRQATIESTSARFTFSSDSLVTIRNWRPITYTHKSLVFGAPWVKGEGCNRQWTDGYGGSLHADLGSGATVCEPQTDSTQISMSADSEMAHMVFPPKPYDFERLYGEGARPHVAFVYSPTLLDDALEQFEDLEAHHIGVFMLWCGIYDQMDNPTCSAPVILESGLRGYQVQEELVTQLHDFVRAAHEHGFRVIPYLSYPSGPRWDYPEGHPRAGEHQEIEVTLRWMREFQRGHGFDGWYFDNADAGDLATDYSFIRQVRSDVGDEGIIYHHDSVDVWGAWDGRRAIMVDAYVNYTLTGETGRATGERAEVDDPNNPYFRYYTSGYGMSQAFGTHKRLSNMRIAMSEEEKDRLVGQNLNGSERTGWYGADRPDEAWLSGFLPAYELRKAEYLSGDFDPDVDWPLDPRTSWFRVPINVDVSRPSAKEAVVRWRTDEPADSSVTYTSNGVWWSPNGPDGTVSDDDLVTEHELEITGLDPGQSYEFRIRSSNQEPGLAEVIWGWVE